MTQPATTELKPLRMRVAILDGEPDSVGDRLMRGHVTIPAQLVPVRLEFDPRRLVGFAQLRFDGERLFADVHLLASVDRASLSGLYPAIEGRVGIGGRRASGVLGCRVSSIGLSRARNTDERIEALP